jgi:hypothetical protein
MKSTPGWDSNFLIEEIKNESIKGREILQHVKSIEWLQKIEEATKKYLEGGLSEYDFNNILSLYIGTNFIDFDGFKEAKINEYLLKFRRRV